MKNLKRFLYTFWIKKKLLQDQDTELSRRAGKAPSPVGRALLCVMLLLRVVLGFTASKRPLQLMKVLYVSTSSVARYSHPSKPTIMPMWLILPLWENLNSLHFQ